jgi:hypothetical protein
MILNSDTITQLEELTRQASEAIVHAPDTPETLARFQSELDQVMLDAERRGLLSTRERKTHRIVAGRPWVNPDMPWLGVQVGTYDVRLVGPGEAADPWNHTTEDLFYRRTQYVKSTSKEIDGPVYRHDCPDCEYKATVQTPDGPVDIHRCPQRGLPTWVARYGNDGPLYTSLLEGMADSMSTGTDPLLDTLKQYIRKHTR